MQGKRVMGALVVLVMMLSCVSGLATSQGNAPEVTITFDKEKISIGETITAHYEIKGPGKYRDIQCAWFSYTSEYEGQGTGHEEKTSLKGETTFVPKFGVAVDLSVSFSDENGQRFHKDSSKVIVEGDNTQAPEVTITFNKEKISIGESITAYYEIKGTGEYRDIQCAWVSFTSEYEGQGTPFEEKMTLKGETSFTPKFGVAVALHVSFYDENGQWFNMDSRKVIVEGDNTQAPEVTITFNKEKISIGESITAYYEIKGTGKYRDIQCAWVSFTSENEGQGTPFEEKTTLKGETSFTPKFGVAVALHVSFYNENGQWFNKDSVRIPLLGTSGGIPLSYPVIDGDNNQRYQGTEDLQFRVDASYEKFRGVLVDDRIVPEDAYDVWSGSTCIRLKQSYLRSLGEGEHTLAVLFEDGIANTRFAVGKTNQSSASAPPRTGDPRPVELWWAFAVISMCCAGVLIRQLMLGRK